MTSTSISLLERISLHEERAAWDRFAELYTPLLYDWARRIGLNQSDAADVVQEVFAIVLKKLPGFRYDPQKSFRGWLRTLVLNRSRDLFRRRAAVSVEQKADSNILDPEDDAALVAEQQEYRQYLVTRALQLMQTDFQETTWKACWMHIVDDRPAKEVAAELEISVNAVYVAKSRVLRRLREELSGLWE